MANPVIPIEALDALKHSTMNPTLPSERIPKKYVFIEDFALPSQPKMPAVIIPKDTIVDGILIDKGKPEVDIPATVQVRWGVTTLTFSVGGKLSKIRQYQEPQATQRFIFVKDIVVSGMPNLPEGAITTQQVRQYNAKKGEIIDGIIDDSPKGKIVRGNAGGLRVQVPFDAVEPMDKKFTDGTQNGMNAALKTSASKPSIFTPKNIFIGVATVLVVVGILKWQKVI